MLHKALVSLSNSVWFKYETTVHNNNFLEISYYCLQGDEYLVILRIQKSNISQGDNAIESTNSI